MNTQILAVDPGPIYSGWVIIDADTRRPLAFDKTPNTELLDKLYRNTDYEQAAIEMVASYGMAVGAEVFDTCVWIGRFTEAIRSHPDTGPELVKRHPVKMHHCHSARANDSNIRQALVDRFALGQPNFGKGTKAQPGWFHGFSNDVWQAYALAVYMADQEGR